MGKYLRKVYGFRGLIVSLARRDLRLKYAQTFLGILWILLQPLTGLVIFSVLFGVLLKIDTGAVPYPLFAFSGIMGWTLFASVLNQSGNSLVSSQDLMHHISFPRLILPVSKMLISLVEFLGILALMAFLMVFMQVIPSWKIVFLPLFVLMNLILGLTVGIWLSAASIRYRDFHHIIPYVLNFGIWLTPVYYPGTLIPDKFVFLLHLNPMAGIISGYRWVLFDQPAPSIYYLGTFSLILFFFWAGVWYFIRAENKILDWI